MSGFEGVIRTESGATGPIMLTIDDRGRVTGQLKIGAAPDFALSGFSGIRSGAEFRAQGRNSRTSSTGKLYDLEVLIDGDIVEGGKAIGGVVSAWLNIPETERATAVPQPWSFEAKLDPGSNPVEVAKPTESLGDLEDSLLEEAPVSPVKEPTWWDALPPWSKTAGAAAAAIGGAALLYRKFRR